MTICPRPACGRRCRMLLVDEEDSVGRCVDCWYADGDVPKLVVPARAGDTSKRWDLADP